MPVAVLSISVSGCHCWAFRPSLNPLSCFWEPLGASCVCDEDFLRFLRGFTIFLFMLAPCSSYAPKAVSVSIEDSKKTPLLPPLFLKATVLQILFIYLPSPILVIACRI